MKNKSACQSISLTLFALLVFVLCRSVALAQETAWIKDKETLAPKGTLQISGNLEMLPLATVTCHVTPSSCDNVQISGAAILDGRLVVNMTGTFARVRDGLCWTRLVAGWESSRSLKSITQQIKV